MHSSNIPLTSLITLAIAGGAASPEAKAKDKKPEEEAAFLKECTERRREIYAITENYRCSIARDVIWVGN